MRRTFALLTLFLCVAVGEARADWLFTPFLGTAFGGGTTLIDLEQAAESTTLVLGGSGAWLSDGVLGFEGDLTYAPAFFERGNNVIVSSNVVTLSGGVLVAVPLGVTRESLRPYLAGGLGLIHAGSEDVLAFVPQRQDMVGMNLGGGAIGFVTNRVGLRFDLRQFRSLNRQEDLAGERRAKLSFWRATVGVVIRY